MSLSVWLDLGLEGIELQLNSLGQPEERAQHRAALITYFEENAELLDEEARRRLHTNPLRILDTKNPAMQDLCTAAPKLIDYLGDESLAHFEGVQRVLRDAGVPYKINPRLVRGLDYYNLTVFEWVTDRLGAQGTVCAGGRYDGLVSQLGGKPSPAVSRQPWRLMSISCIRVRRHRVSLSGSPKVCAIRVSTSFCIAAAVVSSHK